MPLFDYQVQAPAAGCPHCRAGFEVLLAAADAPGPAGCPRCGAPVARVMACPRIGASQTGFHRRAAAAGFKTLKRVAGNKGEYEAV
ncbi:MAG: zinc ribbon domain-containing protein [Candidatus Marinimicrobia bacterium]|nr:zinc ribbon domain-containing protein [Candidatus Neomarinimicrobiota bacterium]